MLLYDKPECPFCWKVRLALLEGGFAWRRDESINGADDPRLLALNPAGTVPVLQDGDEVITDSSLILEYLSDCPEGSALLTGSAIDRLNARRLERYAAEAIGPSLREVVFEKRGNPEENWDLERIATGEAGWRQCLDYLEEQLSERRFFVAEAFGFAECALIPRFALAEHYGVAVDKRHPGLLAWYLHLQQRPSFRAALPINWRS